MFPEEKITNCGSMAAMKQLALPLFPPRWQMVVTIEKRRRCMRRGRLQL